MIDFFPFRRYELFDDYDRNNANIAHDLIDHPNAVYLFEYNRFGHGPTQGDITVRIDAHGGNKSL